MIDRQTLGLARIDHISPRIPDMKQHGRAGTGNFQQNQGAAAFQPRGVKLLMKTLVQRVQTRRDAIEIHRGWQIKQPFDGLFSGFPTMTVAAHAVEYRNPLVTGRPVG